MNQYFVVLQYLIGDKKNNNNKIKEEALTTHLFNALKFLSMQLS